MAPKFVMSFKLNNSNVTDTIKYADDSKSIFSPTHTLLLSCIHSLHALIEFNDYAGHIVTAYSLALMHGIGAVMIHHCLNHCRKIIQFYVVHYCLLYGAIFFVFTRGDNEVSTVARCQAVFLRRNFLVLVRANQSAAKSILWRSKRSRAFIGELG